MNHTHTFGVTCADFEYAYRIVEQLADSTSGHRCLKRFKLPIQFYHIGSLITVVLIAAAPEIR